MIENILKTMIEDAVKTAQKEIIETAAAAVKSQVTHLIRKSEEDVLSTVEDEYLQVRDYDSYDVEKAVSFITKLMRRHDHDEYDAMDALDFVIDRDRRAALENCSDFIDELGMCSSEVRHAVIEFNAMHDELSELITAPRVAPESIENRLKALETKSESDLWGNILDLEKRLDDIENFLLTVFKGFGK